MAAPASDQLANRILRGLAVGVVLGVVTLLAGPKLPLPAGLQELLVHVGVKSSANLLEAMRGISTVLLDPFGRVFLRLLFFVIVPLVFASLATGVVQLGRPDKLGPLAGRTFFLFFLNMAIGVALGLIMMNTLQPGGHIDAETKARLMAEFGGAAQKHVATQAGQSGLSLTVIVEMFMPANLLAAVVGSSTARIGDVLPLILFAILVGVIGMSFPDAKRRRLLDALELVTELMTGIVHLALRLAPYAVPCLIYSVLVKSGLDIIWALIWFLLGCAAVMAIHLFGTMSLWLKLWTQWSPRAYFAAIKDVIVTAFSTSSSNATLPTALQNATEKLKLSPSTAGFVLPLGTTMNMSGTALYEGCVVLFVAQVFGIDLTLGQQVTLLLLSVLSAVAVAGIPGGSLPLIAGLLITFGIPPEGIGIILGTDRILDMCRTATNVGCDVTTAVVVDEMTKRAEARKAGK
ncbi:dicarboxylate/amino acid:cation symporter [Oleiharenicola lentus]|uniref:Dicarboxylate/amino acid:cation symporter n=1 Tax=Oleiharenicola lentus TaxID=2508720 RepID=A0A4V1M694_9BACT|nr:dicarboxylate/amino acid:cation symporter [Oleiharenicola lentus]RXK54609.1 dicarboxylate/amino acid:cation symporter [Oleiharenicola lentus]